MLRILLLGTPAVYLDDQPVAIQRRIHRALFYYLACQPEPVARTDLLLLFWPDEPEQAARRRLTEALSKLRSILPDPNLWITDTSRLGFNSRFVSVDVLEYRALLQEVWHVLRQVPNQSPLPEDIYTKLLSAAQMWHGAHFLNGARLPSNENFDRWLFNTNQDLEYARQQILERIGHHMAAAGDLEGGIYYLRKVLETDELNERLHHQVLLWLQALGYTDEINAYCRHLQDLYGRETGEAPPPELAGFCRGVRLAAATPADRHIQPWPLSLGMQIPFVGRETILRDLRLAFQRGGTVVLMGEAGAGKSRLVNQLYLSMDPLPRLFLAPARSSERNLPFQPIIEMLRNSILQREWLELDSVWLAALSQLLPEVLSLRPNLVVHPVDRPTEARARLFEALRQVLLLASRSQRLLLFLDDAQWADEATLAALSYLQERGFFISNGLLVLAARVEAAAPHLDSFLGQPHNRSLLSRLNLDQMNLREISDLAQYALGQKPPYDLVERLSRSTGGNPLCLLETLRALLDNSPTLDLATSVDRLPHTSSIRELLHDRLRSILPGSRQVLETAAVIGYSFTPEVLEVALDMDPLQIVVALEDLEKTHMIRAGAAKDRPAGYVFIHDVFREVLLRELSLARRRLLNLRVAAALEAVLKGRVSQHAAILAAHFEAGGQVERALEYWLVAASHARRLFSQAGARSAFERAESLLYQEELRIPDELLYRLFVAECDLAYDSTQVDILEEKAAALLRYGEQRRSPLLIGAGFSRLACAHMLARRLDQAQDEVSFALPFLEQSGDVYERMAARICQGTIWLMLHRYHEAAGVLDSVIQLGLTATGESILNLMVTARDRLSLIYQMTGWPGKALQLARDTQQVSRMTPHLTPLSSTFLSLAVPAFTLGQFAQSVAFCHSGIEIAVAAENTRYEGLLNVALARAYLFMGRLDDCHRHLLRGFEIGAGSAIPEVTGEAFRLQGDLLRQTGHYPQALEAYHKGAEGGESGYIRLENMYRQGLTRIRAGAVEEGCKLIDYVVQYSRLLDLGMVWIPALAAHASGLVLLGSFDQARAELLDALDQANQRAFAQVALQARLELLRLDLAQCKPDDVLAAGHSLVDDALALSSPLQALAALECLVEALRQQGADPAPRQQQAAQLLDTLSAHAGSPEVHAIFEPFRQAKLEQIFRP